MLAARSLISPFAIRETARLLQTDLSSALWFLRERRCNMAGVRVSFIAPRAAKQKCPSGEGSCPARLNVNTKHPNPVTGATWDDDFIRGYSPRGHDRSLTPPGKNTTAAGDSRKQESRQEQDSAPSVNPEPHRIATHRVALVLPRRHSSLIIAARHRVTGPEMTSHTPQDNHGAAGDQCRNDEASAGRTLRHSRRPWCQGPPSHPVKSPALCDLAAGLTS